jgi:hypothetical protein
VNTGKRAKGTAMRTAMAEVDNRVDMRIDAGTDMWAARPGGPAHPVRRRPQRVDGRRRPGPGRADGAPLRYRRTGVLLSCAPHRGPRARQRRITPLTTVGLALLAALITIWLGAVAQFGAAIRGATPPVPEKLAVVQVQTGETLAQVAARVAPDAPSGPVVEKIRELNKLDSVAVDAGQTLIAPVS